MKDWHGGYCMFSAHKSYSCIHTLLSVRELLRLSRLDRTLILPSGFGLVGEVGQAVRTGLIPSPEPRLSVEKR